MDKDNKKQLQYKNYTMLALLVAFMVIMFILTFIKMSN